MTGNAQAVALLLEAGADPDAVDGEGRTALMCAAQKNWLSCVRTLVETGSMQNQLTATFAEVAITKKCIDVDNHALFPHCSQGPMCRLSRCTRVQTFFTLP